MAYPETYGPEEHRRALDAMLSDMFTAAPDPLPIQRYRAAESPRVAPATVLGHRQSAGFCEVNLLLDAAGTGMALKLA